ncbi:pentapeptide repeat-containing protein [Pseudomonas fortuita]|uniref:pentapeptide repeat-containing protein n=1 Tax=Pseudomonas fortuita TaxID=3233375 RepID=UPI003C2C64C8
MSLVGKNRKVFSYTNADVRDKFFQHKDFNKAQPYHSNFSQGRFENSSFSATKFKFCGMHGCSFESCDFTGSLFRNCNLQNSKFSNCIIRASIFEKCKLQGVEFNNCIIVGQKIPVNYDLNISNIFLASNPSVSDFDPDLIKVVEELRSNSFIRKSAVFHLKRQKTNTVTLRFLLLSFSSDFLIENIPVLAEEIRRDFYTVSYVVRILTRLAEKATV